MQESYSSNSAYTMNHNRKVTVKSINYNNNNPANMNHQFITTTNILSGPNHLLTNQLLTADWIMVAALSSVRGTLKIER